MPYTRTPPALWKASKTTASWPKRRRSPAHVRPDGPAPMMATRRPVAAPTSGSSTPPSSRSQSARNASILPTETANPRSLCTLATMQFSWHWLSCGHTRPQIAGRRLVVLDEPDGAAEVALGDEPQEAGHVDADRAARDAGLVLAGETAHGLGARLLGRVGEREPRGCSERARPDPARPRRSWAAGPAAWRSAGRGSRSGPRAPPASGCSGSRRTSGLGLRGGGRRLQAAGVQPPRGSARGSPPPRACTWPGGASCRRSRRGGRRTRDRPRRRIGRRRPPSRDTRRTSRCRRP